MDDILNEPIQIDNPKAAIRIAILADESGSMLSAAKATVDAINTYIDEQKTKDEPILASIYTFNSTTGVRNRFRSVEAKNAPCIFRNNDLFENQDIQEHLIYAPAGGTPLYDAIAEVISTESTGVPTLVVILTDGAENASKEYTLNKLQALIQQQESEGWNFIFLMAGLERHFAETYTSHLMGRNYRGATMSYAKGAERKAFIGLTCSTAKWEGAARAAMNVGETLDSAAVADCFFEERDRDIKKDE